MKMWNEERGFGFITPTAGGEDVFVHRSSVSEGVQLSQGMSVNYEAEWDDRKRKERASKVTAAAGGGGAGSSGEWPPSGSSATSAARSTAAATLPRASSHNIVSAAGKWDISRQPMGADPNSSIVRHRITIRNDAPKGSGPDTKKEEFQIVGDATWDKRLFPAGPDREETVVLRPGGEGSRAAGERGKGHGRNWAVEGRPGSVFDVLYDPSTQMVTAELAFREQ